MDREELLEEAKRCVAERGKQHGKPEDVFEDIAALWNAYLADATLTGFDVCMMMVLFKVARAQHNPGHMDNLVDIAGYAACAAECLDKTE